MKLFFAACSACMLFSSSALAGVYGETSIEVNMGAPNNNQVNPLLFGVTDPDNYGFRSTVQQVTPIATEYPQLGTEVDELVATKHSVKVPHKFGECYYRNGVFMLKHANLNKDKYVVCLPYIGAHVPEIPAASSKHMIDGEAYYFYYGAFYKIDDSTKDFVVVPPPVGAVIPCVPSGAKEETIDGEKYYVDLGVAYKQIMYDGKEKYLVVMVDDRLYTINE